MTQYLPTPPIFIHVLLTFIMAWWCFVLLLPGDSFGTAPALQGFARVGSEEQWSAAAGIACICGIAGLWWQRLRVASEHILAIAHGILAVTIVTATPLNPGSGVYAALMMSSWYLILWSRHA